LGYRQSVDAAAAQQLVKDVVLALVGVGDAGVSIIGGHNR